MRGQRLDVRGWTSHQHGNSDQQAKLGLVSREGGGSLARPGLSLAPYLHIQVSPGGGRRVGIGADRRAGVDVIRAEVVYGVADAAADGAAVIPAAKTKTS